MRLSKRASRWRTKLIQEHHFNKYQQRALDIAAGTDTGFYKRFCLAHRAPSMESQGKIDLDALVAVTSEMADAVGVTAEAYASFAAAIAEVMAEAAIHGSDDVIPTGMRARLQR